MADENGEQPKENEVDNFDVVVDEVPHVEPTDETDGDAPKAEPKEEAKPEAGKSESSEADKAKNEPAPDEAANRKPNRFQRRIDKLTKQKADLERENADLKAKGNGSEENKPDAQAEEPKASDYTDYDEYLSDLAAFNEASDGKDDGKGKKEPEKKAESDTGSETPEGFQDALDDVMAAFKDAKDDYDDFDAVVHSEELKITPDMVIALSETDDPAAIAHYLGKHTDEAASIANMTERQQMRAIAKLEDKVGSKKPVGKKTTAAPDPIDDPVRGQGQPATDLKDMTFNDFEKTRNEQEKGGGGFW